MKVKSFLAIFCLSSALFGAASCGNTETETDAGVSGQPKDVGDSGDELPDDSGEPPEEDGGEEDDGGGGEIPDAGEEDSMDSDDDDANIPDIDGGGEDAGDGGVSCLGGPPPDKECCSSNGSTKPFVCIDGNWDCEYPYYSVKKGTCGLEDAGDDDDDIVGECQEGMTACEGRFLIKRCEEVEGRREWVSSPCEVGTICVEGECVPGCVDACAYGERVSVEGDNFVCDLYSVETNDFVIVEPEKYLSDKARAYERWTREYGLAAGGIAGIKFTDDSYAAVEKWQNVSDGAHLTGLYLAGEALRYSVTGSTYAAENAKSAVRTLHRFLRASGERGYLARYAAPQNSGDPRIEAIYDASNPFMHLNEDYEGEPYFWLGDSDRNQYMGMVLGYAFAYDALEDEETREIIREDIVELVKELMVKKPVKPTINGFQSPLPVDAQFIIITGAEPFELTIDTKNWGNTRMKGFVEFMPNLFGYVPRPDSAIMLASIFRVALRVTAGVEKYKGDAQTIGTFYEQNIDSWIGTMRNYSYLGGDCHNDYDVLNATFEGMLNLARFEMNLQRREALRKQILEEKLWSVVKTHRNSWLSFIYAMNAPFGVDLSEALGQALDQIEKFPSPPKFRVATDNSVKYAANSKCASNSTAPIDIVERARSEFIWKEHPFKLKDEGNPLEGFSGVDFTAPYWLARKYRFISDDRPKVCLDWRKE